MLHRKSRLSSGAMSKTQYRMDADAINLRINQKFIEEANALSAKWKAEKLAKENKGSKK